MRAIRLLIAALSLALLGLLPTGSANAVATSGDSVSAKAPITVTGSGVEKRRNGKRVPFIVGSVNPPKGPVYIQKATNCRNKSLSSCNFKFYRKVFVKKGRYEGRIAYAPTRKSWVFRAKVGNATSSGVVTCTRPPGQRCNLP